jgi:Putative diphthamide synthesis protein
MRRFSIVQQARDADVFGILVGTLGVGMFGLVGGTTHLNFPLTFSASYLPLLSHLRTLLRKHHKKSYTLSVGKLNPTKLANFAEIECFVMVACPQNSVVDAKVRRFPVFFTADFQTMVIFLLPRHTYPTPGVFTAYRHPFRAISCS